jgi:glycosyltransferase involved in cell wall biosynthesis
MRIVAVCESPPTTDPHHGNGSTLIARHLLERLAARHTIDLRWFDDRPVLPSAALLDRCASHGALAVRGAVPALLALPLTRLPRATWQRATAAARAEVRALAGPADAVYLHGLHTFALAADAGAPVIVNEIDPWSRYWYERARERSAPRSWYDRLQARRASALERAAATHARRYVVVSPGDADELAGTLGRTVDAIPNGIDAGPAADPALADRSTIAFVGTLDYAPNTAAVIELATGIAPILRARVPGARVLIAGRRPPDAVRALAAPAIEVMADVEHVHDVYARASVVVFPGAFGRGAKNTVREALAAGRPVVATPHAARGLTPGPHLVHAATRDEMVDAIAPLLTDDDRFVAACRAARDFAASLPGWDECAARYSALFDDLA